MRPTIPALIAVLVAMATVATGAPVTLSADTDVDAATAPIEDTSSTDQQARVTPVVSLQNSSGHLSLTGETRSNAEFGNATLNVASSLAMESGRWQTEIDETATLEAFRTADSDANRTAVIEQATNAIDNRTTALRNRQQRAVAAFNRGELSTTEFLERLAVIDDEARQIEEFTSTVRQMADRSTDYSLPNSLRTRLEPVRFGSLRMEPSVLRGPIRSSIGHSLSGESDEFTVYVETTDDGIVLSRVTGNRYIREAFLASETQQSDSNQEPISTISGAYERTRELYPWTVENRISASLNKYSDTTIYQISVDHTQGRLVSYLDGTTTNVFREVQEKDLSRMPISITATNSTGELSIQADLTHESGPMKVNLVRTDTLEPVDARVRLNGQYAGSTGENGRLWTIRPHGPVTVNATTSTGESVDLELGG